MNSGEPVRNHVTPVYRRAARAVIQQAGKVYAAGPRNVDEGAAVCQALADRGIASTLGYFNPPGADPARIVHECMLASNRLSGVGRTFYLSLKPPPLRFHLDDVTQIASTALRHGHRVHFDSHGHDVADRTLELMERLVDRCDADPAASWRFSATLPSRWKRSLSDVDRLAARSIRARLVKGEFAAGAAEEVEPGSGFLALIDRLAGAVPAIGIATHDCALARAAIERARAAGSDTAIELELLYGLPMMRMVRLASELHVPIRIYVAYGESLLLYVARRMAQHPRKLPWFMRGFLEDFVRPGSRVARIAAAR
jgi:proline dehydrogenase